jgi:hypothetical protein
MAIKPNINFIASQYKEVIVHHEEIIEIKNFITEKDCDMVLAEANKITEED